MLPDIPGELTGHQGPIASVYLDVSRDHQDAPHEVQVRWKDLSRELREQGVDEDTLAALDDAVDEPPNLPGRTGRALFAAAGRVLHVADFPGQPRRELARWAPLAHLLPLLAQLPESVPHVVVAVDHRNATVRAIDRDGRTVLRDNERGQRDHTHKAGGGGLSHYTMQRRVEEVRKDNARSFAAEVDSAVSRLHAELVVITGDVQAAGLVLDALGERSRSLAVQVPGPGPDDRTTDGEVGDQVRQLAAERAARRTRQAVEDFEREHGRGSGLAATGLAPVVHALAQNQAAMLIIRDDPSSELQLWVGPQPAQLALSERELRDIGAEVLGQDRADAALVRAAAGTGAQLVLIPHPDADEDPRRVGSAAGGAGVDVGQPELSDGVGAVLRFSTTT